VKNKPQKLRVTEFFILCVSVTLWLTNLYVNFIRSRLTHLSRGGMLARNMDLVSHPNCTNNTDDNRTRITMTGRWCIG